MSSVGAFAFDLSWLLSRHARKCNLTVIAIDRWVGVRRDGPISADVPRERYCRTAVSEGTTSSASVCITTPSERNAFY
ncbi:hypothetical protein EA473_00725 [Natrarchaeobius chitinivorans]|uniref:Uncharacterized protein n=2 Tax=Natrarchaeobius chitinivorans TaxID=1679083 RepID=A0A3N6MNR2_NATCH|nr:hypothetical protein EA473_00725 [Natrarchaeobius chitinivorans]